MRKSAVKLLRTVVSFQNHGLPHYDNKGQYRNPYKNALRQAKRNYNSIQKPDRPIAKKLLRAAMIRGVTFDATSPYNPVFD